MTFELPTILTVTGLAAEKAQDLLETRGYKDGLLRVFVVGGGCSGFQYGMSLAEAPDETDEVVTKNGVRFVIDRESLPLISGARLDYIDDVMKQGFSVVIRTHPRRAPAGRPSIPKLVPVPTRHAPAASQSGVTPQRYSQ